jgi:hypothetical protein
VLDDIIQAPLAVDSPVPEPVFLGLEERRREKLEMDEYSPDGIDVLEIDLDEDGPLREEYLPKRRVSRTNSARSVKSRDALNSKTRVDYADWENRRTIDAEKVLPPPAKWSPAADEPILRDRGRASGQYVAVQPPLTAAHFAASLPQDIRYQNWPPLANCIPVGQHLATGYVYDPMSVQQLLPAYTPYPHVGPSQSHSRSHSFSSDHENCYPRNHFRSHSQSVFDYGCGDILMAANENVQFRYLDAQWAAPAQYGCAAPYRQPFGPLPNVNHQSTWLRT